MHENSFRWLTSLFAILALAVLVLASHLFQKQAAASPPVLRMRPASLLALSPLPSVRATPSLPPELDIEARSYLVQLIGDTDPLLERRAHERMRPASLTKILTSLVAMEELNAGAPVVFSSYAKAAGEKESPVPAGEAFERDDAIRFAMIESANDAAVALAEAVGRKRGAFSFEDAISLFVQAANQKARRIGMTDSQFQNPTGLDDDNHYTTARDLFRLVSYAESHYSELWDFSRSSHADITSMAGHTYHIEATNQLLSEFPALHGGKTGLTDLAKGALILLYPVKPDRTAVIVILGSDNRFDDGRKLINWLEKAFN